MDIYFSKEGINKFKKEISGLESRLKYYQSKVNEICEVGGDAWHDNAGYDRLTEDIRMTNKKINDSYSILNKGKIVEYPSNPERICLGSRVNILLDGKELNYDIVGYGEGDPNNSKIAYNSPLATYLIGHEIGDRYTAKIGLKKKEIEILDVLPIGESNE